MYQKGYFWTRNKVYVSLENALEIKNPCVLLAKNLRRRTWTGGDSKMAPRLLDKTVQSIILDNPAKHAICTDSNSPSIKRRSSSGSAPNSTILPSRCTALIFRFFEIFQTKQK